MNRFSGMTASQVFCDQLDLIDNDKIAGFVVGVIVKLGKDEFFTRPASLTGKHHPEPCRGDGGLVIHTKYAVNWGLALLPMYGDTLKEFKDHVVAALILHDLMKGSTPEGCSDKDHGPRLAKAIHDMAKESGKELTPDEALIALGINCHMGIWGPEGDRIQDLKEPGHRIFCSLVHLADYCASRNPCDLYKD